MNNNSCTLKIEGDFAYIEYVKVNDREYWPDEEIPCAAGDLITFGHDPERFWNYYDKNGNIHRLGSMRECSIEVPAGAEGIATIHVHPGQGDFHYDVFRIDRSSGWIKDKTFTFHYTKTR